MSVTIKDIAEAAGVDPAVVSVALNNKSYIRISQKRREEIRRIAQEMNYRPNLQASSLRSGKQATIGVFLPSWQDVLLLELIKGLSDGSQHYKIPLTYFFGMDAKSYSTFIDSMTSFKHTGIISYVPYWNQDYEKILYKLEEYLENGGKIISLNTLNWPMTQTLNIDFDEPCGGTLAGEYLKSCHGLKSFALLTLDSTNHRLRDKAFLEKIPGAALHRLPVNNPITGEMIKNELEKMFDAANGPLGIFATSTEFCKFILEAAARRGWMYGKDFAVVGYDLAERFGDTAPIARINQPFYRLGVTAMEKLNNILLRKPVESSVFIKPELHIPEN